MSKPAAGGISACWVAGVGTAVPTPTDRPYGNGVLLWFEIDDFDAAVARAGELRAEIVLPPHRNPPEGNGGPDHRECWLRDPADYIVALASPDGEASRHEAIADRHIATGQATSS